MKLSHAVAMAIGAGIAVALTLAVVRRDDTVQDLVAAANSGSLETASRLLYVLESKDIQELAIERREELSRAITRSVVLRTGWPVVSRWEMWSRIAALDLLDVSDPTWWEEHVGWAGMEPALRPPVLHAFATAATHRRLGDEWGPFLTGAWSAVGSDPDSQVAVAHLSIAVKGRFGGVPYAVSSLSADAPQVLGQALVTAIFSRWVPEGLARKRQEHPALIWVKRLCSYDLLEEEWDDLRFALAVLGWPDEITQILEAPIEDAAWLLGFWREHRDIIVEQTDDLRVEPERVPNLVSMAIVATIVARFEACHMDHVKRSAIRDVERQLSMALSLMFVVR